MQATLIKTFTFEAAHFLPRVPRGHKCRRLHGHSFKCDIEVSGRMDAKTGWLMDYAEIKHAFEPVVSQLDHRFLNQDVPGLENPTSENICRWIWKKLKPNLPGLSAVTIHETSASSCTYRGK